MLIRPAKADDVKEIKKIADSLQVSRSQAGWQKADTGFFEYVKTEQDFLDSLNFHFTIAKTERGIRGYCLAYDDVFLRERHGDSENPCLRFLLENCGENYVFVDQFGVFNPDNLSSGCIANLLANDTISIAMAVSLDKIVACVPQRPYFNFRSDRFLRRKGFRQFGEVLERDIVLGVYELGLR